MLRQTVRVGNQTHVLATASEVGGFDIWGENCLAKHHLLMLRVFVLLGDKVI